MSSTLLKLPPRRDNVQESSDAERQYRTALSAPDYLLLEQESMSRGLRPFTFVKTLVTLYLHGGVVIISELPEPAQLKLKEFLAQFKKV